MPDDPVVPISRIRDINARARAILERETVGKPFWLGGLVRNHYLSDMGHLYFTLFDGNHSIRCMVPESARGNIGFTIANGMEVEVYGTVRVYEPRAMIEVEIEEARLIERGSAAYVDVEEQLKKQGLWPRKKRPLPAVIKQIGVVTSKQSDALPDFDDTYRREAVGSVAPTTLVDVRLQGDQAPREIADAITRLYQEGEVDVIVLIRGGGRGADLAVFDDYLIAEAICRSHLPVVTGIGHKRDETIADRVADIAAITPTDAALRLAKGTGELMAVSPLEALIDRAGDLFQQPTAVGASPARGGRDWRVIVVAIVSITALLAIFLLILTR